MRVFVNSDTFGSISIRLLVNDGKVMKVIHNCTVSDSKKKCLKCVYLSLCNSLQKTTKNLCKEDLSE